MMIPLFLSCFLQKLPPNDQIRRLFCSSEDFDFTDLRSGAIMSRLTQSPRMRPNARLAGRGVIRCPFRKRTSDVLRNLPPDIVVQGDPLRSQRGSMRLLLLLV